MKQTHNKRGNCWHKSVAYDKDGNVMDVCMRHCEVRGECDKCPRCKWCDELARRAGILRAALDDKEAP